MTTVVEERDIYLDMLRRVAKQYSGALPPDVQLWWTSELQRIASQKANNDARKAAQKQDLADKIADLQAKLAALG